MDKKNRRKGRCKNSISKSCSALTKDAELEHLDGLSYIHFLDVQSNWELLKPEEKAAERKHAALLESYYFGGGGRFDLICNLWFGDDLRGVSEAVVMPSKEWKANIRMADDARRKWRDGTRTRTAPQGEFSGNLLKIFCRLTPWNALAARQYLKREDIIEGVREVAARLQNETGLKIVGAAVHRETEYDIHIHFIVSKIVPVEIVKDPYSDDYIKKLTTSQRKIIREELRKRGDDISLKAVDEELAMRREKGELKDPTAAVKVVEYQTLDRAKAPRRGLASMGQTYCSKTNLWEASGRDPAVAAVQEGHSKVSFRSVVQDAAAVAPNGDPSHKYIDYWLAQQWNQVVLDRLPVEIQYQLPEVARRAAQRYVEEGSSLANPALDAAREKENKIIFDAAQAAFGIKKLAAEEAERIIAEAENKLRDSQSDLEKTLHRNRQHEATLKELTVTANTAINQNKVVRNNLEKREKALELREEFVRSEKAKNEKLQKKTANRKRRLESVNSILRMRAAKLRKIPVARVVEKLGFLPDEQGVYQGEFTEVTNTKFQNRVFIDGEKFRVESLQFSMLKGGFEWTQRGSGNGAIDCMKVFMPKMPISLVCNRLAELFPESKEGLILELLESSNPELWKGLSQQRSAQAPAVKLHPNLKPDSKKTPEAP